MERLILHADMDAFFASVEQLDHPEWWGRPVVVGASPNQRGVVAAASYEARRFGIRSAMPSVEAGRRCPDAIFTPPRRDRYEEMSARIFDIFRRFTPDVEPLSIDEAFLDVSGSRRLFGDGATIASTLRATVQAETRLTVSVGVASNTFLAKLASDLNKPDGQTVVPCSRDAIIAFLDPLPVTRIWGVGTVLQARLGKIGIHTIGDLQRCAADRLEAAAGRHAGEHLRRLAFGEDDRSVETAHEEKSLSGEHTFPRDTRDAQRLESTLMELTEQVGARLRATGRYAGTARLKLRWRSFQTITRQRPLDPPCCDDFSLRRAALTLLRSEGIRQPVRLIGFGVSGLQDRPVEQLSLFETDGGGAMDKRERLSRVVDELRERYGAKAPQRGGKELPAPCAST